VHHGNEGSVAIGANTVAEVQSWTYDEQDIDVQEAASMGDTAVTVLASGIKSGGGTIECLWDETDSNGQSAMDIGSSVTLNLYPEGASNPDTYYTGTAIITGVGVASSVRGLVTRNFTFRGPLTESTVPA